MIALAVVPVHTPEVLAAVAGARIRVAELLVILAAVVKVHAIHVASTEGTDNGIFTATPQA